MSLRNQFKKAVERSPPALGKLLAAVPFELRFGPAYKSMKQQAVPLRNAPSDELKGWILPKLQEIVAKAYRETLLYRTIYQRCRYDPQSLRTIAHFADVPIVTKNDMREFGIGDRSIASPGRMLINTGGTSGEPLAFYVDARAFAREWAHMHLIWEQAGYRYRDQKLTMRGGNLGDRLIRYNPIHNEYIVNTYADRHSLAAELKDLLARQRIRWIHGYPSIVSEIVSDVLRADSCVIDAIRLHLKGVLLGSEFPAPQYTESIRSNLGVRPTAWYGHSEMCILAYEHGENRYVPMQSYGFVEAVGEVDRGQRLLGTSYWNIASPFIRYDSGDLVSAEYEDGVVKSFAVSSGRIGDFVVDGTGMRISLTALIFGRHHLAFDRTRHIQVRQKSPGIIELLVVPDDRSLTLEEIMAGFDFSNVKLDVRPVLIDEPIRTGAGKIRLLV